MLQPPRRRRFSRIRMFFLRIRERLYSMHPRRYSQTEIEDMIRPVVLASHVDRVWLNAPEVSWDAEYWTWIEITYAPGAGFTMQDAERMDSLEGLFPMERCDVFPPLADDRSRNLYQGQVELDLRCSSNGSATAEDGTRRTTSSST